ncbi:MAG: hypothetical protein LUE27_07350 [Clostridia bacterium]|nr:hypothetical protein [Clostridia bacterium]
MSRKKKQPSPEARQKRDMQKTVAFWGLAIAAILFVVYAVMNMIYKFAGLTFDSNTFNLVMNIFGIISKIFILLAVALPAYSYVRGRKRGWKIFYWIALIIYAVCVVFDIVVVA